MTYCPLDCSRNPLVSAKYVVNNLVLCGNCVSTHTFSHRAFFTEKYLKSQSISKPKEEEISFSLFRGKAMFRRSQRVGEVLLSGFAGTFLWLFSTQHSSAPPCGGCRSMASSYCGVIGRHLSCLIRNAVFLCGNLGNRQKHKKKKLSR